jgi:hypothetical protein
MKFGARMLSTVGTSPAVIAVSKRASCAKTSAHGSGTTGIPGLDAEFAQASAWLNAGVQMVTIAAGAAATARTTNAAQRIWVIGFLKRGLGKQFPSQSIESHCQFMPNRSLIPHPTNFLRFSS